MKFKCLESGRIKLYKRENSQYWQMKIKLPKQKAIRSSTGSKILKESKKIALKYYSSISIENKLHIQKRSKSIFKNMHLVENLVLPKKRFAVFHFNPISNKIDTVLYQKIDFKLSSKKEKIELFDQNEQPVDEVAYKLKTIKKSYSRNIPFETFKKVKAKWENNNDLTMGYHNTSYTKILINKKESNKKLIFALVCFAMLFGLIAIYYLKRNKKKSTNSL